MLIRRLLLAATDATADLVRTVLGKKWSKFWLSYLSMDCSNVGFLVERLLTRSNLVINHRKAPNIHFGRKVWSSNTK